jgi:hypothetical protein
MAQQSRGPRDWDYDAPAVSNTYISMSSSRRAGTCVVLAASGSPFHLPMTYLQATQSGIRAYLLDLP